MINEFLTVGYICYCNLFGYPTMPLMPSTYARSNIYGNISRNYIRNLGIIYEKLYLLRQTKKNSNVAVFEKTMCAYSTTYK